MVGSLLGFTEKIDVKEIVRLQEVQNECMSGKQKVQFRMTPR